MKKEIKEKIIEILRELDELHNDGFALPEYLEKIADQILELFEEENELIAGWEKEFDKKFVIRFIDGKSGKLEDYILNLGLAFKWKNEKEIIDGLKSFVRQLLAQEKQKWIQEVEKEIDQIKIDPLREEREGIRGYQQNLFKEIIKRSGKLNK